MWSERVVPFAIKNVVEHFPGGPAGKNPPANAGDTGSTPGQGTGLGGTKPMCQKEGAQEPYLGPGVCTGEAPAVRSLHTATNE